MLDASKDVPTAAETGAGQHLIHTGESVSKSGV